MKHMTKTTGFKAWLWVEIAAALLLTVWVKFPYLLCGVSKKALLEHLVVILSIWAVIAIGAWVLLALAKRVELTSLKIGLVTAITLLAGVMTAFEASPYLLPEHDYVAIDLIAGAKSENTQGHGGREVWLSWCHTSSATGKFSEQPVIKVVNFEYIAEEDLYVYRDVDGTGSGLLRFAFPGDEQITLTFAKSQWSGMLKIVNHATGMNDQLDLFLSDGDEAYQEYTILPGHALSPWKKAGMIAL